ncbi:MAG TPA: sialidase family protein [Chitinophagaceae bacterium]|nr:sialidase family protein [Chitinophagaceae bacterium]
MKRRILFIACMVIMTDFCNGQTGTGDATDISIIDTLPANSPYSKVWQPYLAILKDHTYIATYGFGLQGKTDMGDIVCAISKDNGKTWGHRISIFSSEGGPYAYANSFFYQDPVQDILWCYAMRCPKFYKNSEESELVAAYSPDKGLTWIPVPLSVDFHSPLITNASILKVTDERGPKYLLAVHRNTLQNDPNGDRRQFVLESRDLLSWKLAGFIPMPGDKPIFLCEGNMAPGDDGHDIKIVMRTGDYKNPGHIQVDPPRAYSSISKDNGQTWSAAKEEPALYNTYSKGFFGKDGEGTFIYVYNDGPIGKRTSLRYDLKREGKEWSESRLFYWDNNRNSYPTLIEETSGTFACVWDSSNDPKQARTVIRFGRLKVD